MNFTNSLSENEIRKQIQWLENEINLCLEYDLPTNHLENQLSAIDEILYYNEKIRNDSIEFMVV